MLRDHLTLSVMVIFLSMPAHAGWVAAPQGQLPPSAVVAGKNSNGQPFHVCRAQYGGGVHPGTLTGNSPNCNIAYNGSEYQLPDYEVLVDEGYGWVSAYDGEVPFDALPGGKEQQSDVLYVCRGEVNSEMRPGKIRHAGACKVPYAGQEQEVFWYEVLVGN